jgi:hypothetical protein
VPVVIESCLSPIGLQAMAVRVVGLAIKSLLCCKQLNFRQRYCSAVVLLFTFATSSVDRVCICEKPGTNGNVSIRFAMTLGLLF